MITSQFFAYHGIIMQVKSEEHIQEVITTLTDHVTCSNILGIYLVSSMLLGPLTNDSQQDKILGHSFPI